MKPSALPKKYRAQVKAALEKPTEIWCPLCGKWGDHGSAQCRDLNPPAKQDNRNVTQYQRPAKSTNIAPHIQGLPVPEYEVRFHPDRKWRFDAAWPAHMIALEVDGGLYVNGGHSRGAAREGDYEKDAAALMLGWRVLRVSTGQLKKGLAREWLTQLLTSNQT